MGSLNTGQKEKPKKITTKQLNRYEKINYCVETGALIIAIGVITGTLTSALILNPFPIYAGTAIGYGVAIDQCYKYFHGKRNMSPCDLMYGKDDKVLIKGTSKLPSVTEYSKSCINSIEERQREEDEKKYQESDKSRKPCHMAGHRSKKTHRLSNPLKRFTNGPKLITQEEAEKNTYSTFPLKRFTNRQRLFPENQDLEKNTKM